MPCTWERVFGTSEDDKAQGATAHPDGGFVAVGNSRLRNGHDYDAWILHFSDAGHLLWNRSLGGAGADQLYDVARGADGGFMAVGHTRSRGNGESDAWLVKVALDGDPVFDGAIGGPGNDRARAVAALPGGGFAVAGFSASTGEGDRDLWVLRLDAAGRVVWQRTYGGPGHDAAYDVAALANGDIAVAGVSRGGAAHGHDAWVLRLDPQGEITWQRRFDSARFEAATALAALPGGGLAVAGAVGVNGTLSDDLWIARLDADGTTAWHDRLGGAGRDTPWGLARAADGSLLVAAVTWTDDAGAGDLWLLGIDSDGAVAWERRFGGRYWDKPTGLLSLPDGMLMVGHTSSQGFGFEDGWLLRLDGRGELRARRPEAR
ncbi:hypothetical protein [Roseovarius salinarum]|uniref:hypothetical protein n=1 Tax=Roseovarius salinarum TaxID=1981892 RepID=UPI000C33B47A|nr:hypothetical protein [Roseovarius salinarum]